MARQGRTTIDFGAWPGSGDASIAVTGQTEIVTTSVVEAWIIPEATIDHSADEHWLDPPQIFAGNIIAAFGFTIYATGRDRGSPDPIGPKDSGSRSPSKNAGPYGKWTVAWCWN